MFFNQFRYFTLLVFLSLCSKEYLLPKFEKYTRGNEGMVEVPDAVNLMKKEFPAIPERYLTAMINRFIPGTSNTVDMYQFVEFFSFVKSKLVHVLSRPTYFN